jgi:hypothetical protein
MSGSSKLLNQIAEITSTATILATAAINPKPIFFHIIIPPLNKLDG